MVKEFIKKEKENIWVALGFAFVLGIFAPLDFYFSTIDEFWVDIYDIAPGILITSLCVFLILFGLGVGLEFIPKVGGKIANVFRYMIITLTIAFYIQGNFLEVPYGALFGADIEWDTYGLYNLSSTIVWCALILGMIAIAYKVKHDKYMKVMRVVMICLMITTFISMIIESFAYNGWQKKELKKATVANEWEYSKTKNFNIVCLDSFDSRILCDMIAEDGLQNYNDIFEDFTFYRDSLCTYTLTDYSVPVILTGEKYLNQSTYGEFIDKAYGESPLLTRLSEEGWNENIYTGITLPQGKPSKEIRNLRVLTYKAIKPVILIRDYYGLVGFKYMPTPLKRYFYDRYVAVNENCTTATIDGVKVVETEEYTSDISYGWENLDWLYGISNMNVSKEEPVFHYYHLKGIHGIRDVNLNLEKVENGDVSPGESARMCFRVVATWINKLKEEGLYDNSIIIIMADHGCDDYEEENSVMQCPLLLIKGSNEHHDFQVSDIPVAYEDLQEAYMALMDGKNGTEVFRTTMDECNIEFDSVSGTYSAEELVKKWNNKEGYDREVGRERNIYYTWFRRAMGVDTVGETFYEGYTDYPAYNSSKVFQTGNVFE